MDSVFECIDQEQLVEQIVGADRRVCFVGPGIYDWIGEALIQAADSLGPQAVTVIIDPTPHAFQIGHGTEEALQKLRKKGVIIRVQPGVRIGLIVIDESAAVFSLPALNVDAFPKSTKFINGFRLSSTEAARIVGAIAPGWNPQEDATAINKTPAELGTAALSDEQVESIHQELTDHPPVAPDLARQMLVINSTFKVIHITLTGARLSQRRLQLKAEELGIDKEDLKRRIGGSYKLFESDIDQLTRELDDQLEEIKKRHKVNSIGDIGQVFLAKDQAALEADLQSFCEKLKSKQNDLSDQITKDLEESKARLRDFLLSKLPSDGDKNRLERRVDNIFYRMKFPAAKDVLSLLKCDWSILNISEQLMVKPEFRKKIEQIYGESIENLTKIEPAVGVRK